MAKKDLGSFSKFLILLYGILSITYFYTQIIEKDAPPDSAKVKQLIENSNKILEALYLDNNKFTEEALDTGIGRSKIAYSVSQELISYNQIEMRLKTAGYKIKKCTAGEYDYLSTEKDGWYYTIDNLLQYKKSKEKIWTIVAC